MNLTQSSQSQKTVGEIDFDFEPGNFFDKDLISEYSNLISPTQPQQNEHDGSAGSMTTREDGNAFHEFGVGSEHALDSGMGNCVQGIQPDKAIGVDSREEKNDQPCGSRRRVQQQIPMTLPNQREKSVDLSSVDPRQGFRMSNWIRGDGTVDYGADLVDDERGDRSAPKKKQTIGPVQTYNYPGFRTANAVHQERQISEDEDDEDDESNNRGSSMNRYLARQYKKASLGYSRNKRRNEEAQSVSDANGNADEEEEECSEAERMRRKVRMYDENYGNSADSLRAYNKLMYKKASLPINLIASSYHRSPSPLTSKNEFLNSSYERLSKKSVKREPISSSSEVANNQQIVVKQEPDNVIKRDSSSTVMLTTVKQERIS